MTPTAIKARPARAASAASRRSLRMASDATARSGRAARTAEERRIRNAVARVAPDGAVESGGGRLRHRCGEGPVGGDLGGRDEYSRSVRRLPEDLHEPAGGAVDATTEVRLVRHRQGDADRRPSGGLEPLEAARSRQEELPSAVRRADVPLEAAVELGDRSARTGD